MGELDKINEEIFRLQKEVVNLLDEKQTTHGCKRALRNLLKELFLFQNHIKGIKALLERKKEINPKRIQIGGGRHFLKGFLNIDIFPPADILYDVREGIPLEDCCSELIFTEHFLEHIDYPVSVKKFIKECYRVLKKKGKIIIGVPDAELAVKSYLRRDREFWETTLERWYKNRNFKNDVNSYIDLLNFIFRDQDDDPKYTPHLWAYDFEKLKSLLENVGFQRIRKWRFNEEIANPERKWGSLYVIGTK